MLCAPPRRSRHRRLLHLLHTLLYSFPNQNIESSSSRIHLLHLIVMSNSHPWDAAASQAAGPPHGGDADPWNWQSLLATLPPPLQLLLNDIMRTCHAACSNNTETANAVTRELHGLLQQLVADIDGELQSNPCSGLRTCSDSWRLLAGLSRASTTIFKSAPESCSSAKTWTRRALLLLPAASRTASRVSSNYCLRTTTGQTTLRPSPYF